MHLAPNGVKCLDVPQMFLHNLIAMVSEISPIKLSNFEALLAKLLFFVSHGIFHGL